MPYEHPVSTRIRPVMKGFVRATAGGLGVAALGYAAASAVIWARYGHASPGSPLEQDPPLDRFMPAYKVVERHHIAIDAPAEITLAAAGDQDLMSNRIIRSVFKARELVLGSTPSTRPLPQALLPQVLALGWRVLFETPGREIVVGAVTQPWEADVTFRGLTPDEFAAFNDPGYVKIVWSLRADPLGVDRSIFRTETRARATDPSARAKFRRYWSLASPGIWLIRRASLGPLKEEAERRSRSRTSDLPVVADTIGRAECSKL